MRRLLLALLILVASSTTASVLSPSAAYAAHKPPPPCDVPGKLYEDEDKVQWICICWEIRGKERCMWVKADPKWRTITNVKSRLYMDVEGASHDNGARIIQFGWKGGLNQQWILRRNLDYTVRIESLNTANKCVGVRDARLDDGAPIIQWTCNGNKDQNWIFGWTGQWDSDRYPVINIVNVNSGHLLVVNGGDVRPGAPLIQWPHNGAPDQRWF